MSQVDLPSTEPKDKDEESQVRGNAERDRKEGCLVCYDELGDGTTDADKSDDEVVVVEECRHVFCRKCLQQHCQHAISGRQLPIPCPCKNDPEKACTVKLAKGLVERLLLSQNNEQDVAAQRAWRLYQRLERLRLDPSLLTCPWCDALVESRQRHRDDGEQATSREISNSVSCPACHGAFCAVHGNAHPRQTCARYSQRQKSASETKTESVLSRYTRACSHCGGRIQKESGCDHVVCAACGNDMCYRCGTHRHLTGRVIRSCSRCQMSYMDHRHECAYRFRVIIFLPLIVPCFLMYVILMVVLAVITGGFGCCFGWGSCLGAPRYMEVEQERWQRALSMGLSIVALPFIGLMRDFGVRSCRMPHEIYMGIRASGEDETPLPEIPTMHVTEDVESPTNSSNECSSQTSNC